MRKSNEKLTVFTDPVTFHFDAAPVQFHDAFDEREPDPQAFAAGVAAGTAAVPLEGRMIDAPVDEWAKVVLATAEACAARDARKQAALTRPRTTG